MSPRTNSDLESKEDCRRFDPRLYANIGSWLGRLLCACPHALSLTISAQQARRQQTMSASLLHHGELAEADRGEASALSLSPRTRCESCPSAPTKPASNSINPHLLPAMGSLAGAERCFVSTHGPRPSTSSKSTSDRLRADFSSAMGSSLGRTAQGRLSCACFIQP